MPRTYGILLFVEHEIWQFFFIKNLLFYYRAFGKPFFFEFWQNFAIKGKVGHTVALPFTLNNILRQKKNYENSNISPCKNVIFKKSSKRNQNRQDIITQ
jgi:hypothetical protein